MTTAGAPPSLPAPSWPHCARDADPTSDPVGCRGRQVEPYGSCLAHLTSADRSTYLSSLSSGGALDHRGTLISEDLLHQLLNALRDPATGRRYIDAAWFDGATFHGEARFRGVTFSSYASFVGATFSGEATFEEATFSNQAWFQQATFSGHASFDEATFADYVSFDRATFSQYAIFSRVTFSGDAVFGEATFSDHASFTRTDFSGLAWFDDVTFSGEVQSRGVTFSGDAWFDGVTFENASQLGPLICQGALVLSGARFVNSVIIAAAATRLECQQTRWNSTAALWLRRATVNLRDAVFEYPVSITARTAPFEVTGAASAERDVVGSDPAVCIESVRGADAAHLVLHNVDLRGCLLSGAVHLDQLRLEGEFPLAPTPSGLRLRGLLPMRWTVRRTVAEEQHWRAAQGWTGWTAAPAGVEVVGPAQLAPVYRQLRKSFEDSKNEPDSADFYYGEMEMRRHDHKRPRAERTLLAVYWAVSGYGLRASRALGWLLSAMAATVLIMMLWGLPQADPKPTTSGRLNGQDISLTTDKPAPGNPTGSLHSRLTSERWEKSLRIVVNSVVFRSSGQDLTTTGTYTEMASRLAEPVLLGLAALAIRGRVKR
ncbi:pentapeptide repeat-containing protein [Streptomyces sp. NPDC056527]|uniref:pentapeptide repeat-containing protein n=1 Tax=Streptomyces sp. NPDC056527 TaxID=3345853 RepID=UPI00367AC2E9